MLSQSPRTCRRLPPSHVVWTPHTHDADAASASCSREGSRATARRSWGCRASGLGLLIVRRRANPEDPVIPLAPDWVRLKVRLLAMQGPRDHAVSPSHCTGGRTRGFATRSVTKRQNGPALRTTPSSKLLRFADRAPSIQSLNSWGFRTRGAQHVGRQANHPRAEHPVLKQKPAEPRRSTHPKAKLPAAGVTRRNGGGYVLIEGVTPGKLGAKPVITCILARGALTDDISWIRFVLHGYLTLRVRCDAVPPCVPRTVRLASLKRLTG